MKVKTALALYIGYLGMVLISYAAYTVYLTIETNGTIIEGVDITASPSSIDWGNVTVAVPVTRNTTLTNIGDETAINLTMTTSNVYGLTNFTCIWDCNGINLTPMQSIKANFTLTVYNYTDTNFGFDIFVGGS